MTSNSNLKVNKITLLLLIIISILSIVVIYQSNTINKLKSKQTSEFFIEAKVGRDKSIVNTLQALKALIDNEKVSKEDRKVLTDKYIDLALARSNEVKIEYILKSKGYEETLVFISDNIVRVIIKSDKNLNEKQLNEIKDIVTTVIKVRDIDIEIRL